jgi:nucleoside-diphosphate-sugar epimerase
LKILVTGGSGFNGTHVCRLLLQENHDVRVLDIKEPSVEGVDFVCGDINDPVQIAPAFVGVERVVHLAAVVGVSQTEAHPLKTQPAAAGARHNFCST